MLFTTATFAFLYLPLVALGFFVIARVSHAAAASWLFAASVFFYGYWAPEFVLLLLTSIVTNFVIGGRIGRLQPTETTDPSHRAQARRWMIGGVVFNLALLAYFKYANFFIGTVEGALGMEIDFIDIVLPIGISFFTFTQIAFLADAYQKGVREYKFSHYGLFVTYFPHLVAGPVLHHAQMMPQFARAETYRFQFSNVAAGLAIFALGLFKKVVIADGISPYADAIFDPATAGVDPTTAEAWLGALAYTFQLYFDFSGYSDMAIGLSWIFNVRLPFNFDSPYKSLSISDFWRRWHMTLSAFLRDYLYIVLGGNRRGPTRRYVNLFLTMLLGGLWHGANWTFVFWGALHGLYLGINHLFRHLTEGISQTLKASKVFAVLAWAITFLSVVVAWVFFRAPTFDGALRILGAMVGGGAAEAAEGILPLVWNAGLHPLSGFAICAVLLAISAFAPNTNAIGEWIRGWCRRAGPRGLACGAALASIVFLIVVNEARDAVSAFIYFNF